MTVTLTLHTPEGPQTFIGIIVPPCGHDIHSSLRFSGLSGNQASVYYEYLHGLLGQCIRLDELESAIERAQFQAALRASNEQREQRQ